MKQKKEGISLLKSLKKNINKTRRKILQDNKAVKLKNLGYSELKYVELLELIRRNRNSDVFEIFGSGWSINSTLQKVVPHSFKAGFNLSGYTKLCFDLYLFETTSANYIGQAQRELLNSIKIENLILKNLWFPIVDIKQIKNNHYPHFQFLKDEWVPHDRKITFSQVNSIINSPQNFYQIGATFTCLIVMAIQCGFKTIVLHGIDFMGEHFFHSPDWEHEIPLNYGRLDCPDGRLLTRDGKSGEAVYENAIVKNKDLECANYVNMNIIPDSMILRALYLCAKERDIKIIAHAPSTSVNILR